MREVLRFDFDASSDTVLVRTAAWAESTSVHPTTGARLMNTDGSPIIVRQLGVPEPQATFALSELPEPHGTAFRALLAVLPDLVEAKVTALVSAPASLVTQAAELAAERMMLEKERAESRAALAEAAALTADLAAKRVEADQLDAEIAAKRVEIEAARAATEESGRPA